MRRVGAGTGRTDIDGSRRDVAPPGRQHGRPGGGGRPAAGSPTPWAYALSAGAGTAVVLALSAALLGQRPELAMLVALIALGTDLAGLAVLRLAWSIGAPPAPSPSPRRHAAFPCPSEDIPIDQRW
jgi:hypothetical protein